MFFGCQLAFKARGISAASLFRPCRRGILLAVRAWPRRQEHCKPGRAHQARRSRRHEGRPKADHDGVRKASSDRRIANKIASAAAQANRAAPASVSRTKVPLSCSSSPDRASSSEVYNRITGGREAGLFAGLALANSAARLSAAQPPIRDKRANESCPARLMRGAQARTGVAVKVFVEK